MRLGLAVALFAGALAAGSAASAASSTPQWRSVPLTGYASRSALMVDGTQATYHRFDATRALSFSVEGPKRLKVLTRLVIPNSREKDSYSVSVVRDGVVVQTRDFDTVPAERAFYVVLDSVRPGVVRRLYIDVPTGRHSYELRAGGLARVDARVFASSSGDAPQAGIAPRGGAPVEVLLSGGKELAYHVLSAVAPIVVDVVGPTTVRVNTRLLFDLGATKRESYAIGVSEAGGHEVLYRIEAGPSTSVLCRDRSDVVPGALRHISMEVGEGSHALVFRLAEPPAGRVALSFNIPRGDVRDAP